MKFSRTLFVSVLLIPVLTARPTAAFLDTPKPLRVGIVDWQFDVPEQAWEAFKKDDYLSGSVVRKDGEDVNVPVPCKAKSCANIQFTDPLPVKVPTLSVDGKIWEHGLKHLVPGGFGPLAVVNGGLEPTGRMVVNPQGVDNEAEFKVVAVKFDQATGVVTFQAFFRACIRAPFSDKWLSCTPIFIPSPIFWQVKETQIIPIDINTNIKPIKLPKSVKADIKNTLKASLKNAAINQGLNAAGAFAGSGGGGSGDGGSSGGSSGGSCQTSYGHKAHKEADPSGLVAVGGDEKLQRDAAAAFDKMRLAARNSGIDLLVVSGFRSVADQTDLWDNQVQRQGSESAAAKISAPPGYSEHHTGYALDVGVNGVANLTAGFENTPAYSWLSKNAATFGFEQSFTRTSTVGADNEPWHWRFTGTTAAKAEFSTSGCGYGGGGNSSGGGGSSSSVVPNGGGSCGTSRLYQRPASGPITSPFGIRIHPITGQRRMHYGQDLGTPSGSPVSASDCGRVTYAQYAGGLGNFICVAHPDRNETCTAHLSTIFVRVGQSVTRGQKIGLSGSTGHSTGPHVHSELHPGGYTSNLSARDPYPYYQW
jgi:uncharacterized membrane protein YgcG